MKWIAVTATALVLSASAIPVRAAGRAECPVPRGAVKVALPSGLPPGLREALGNVALPREPFDATDVYVKGDKHSRYIFVWKLGSRWLVATEEGGKALHAAIVTYDLSKGGRNATLIEKRITSPTNFCAAAINMARE